MELRPYINQHRELRRRASVSDARDSATASLGYKNVRMKSACAPTVNWVDAYKQVSKGSVDALLRTPF